MSERSFRRESRRRARRRRRVAGLAATGAAIGTAALPAGATAVTFTVTNTNDAGPGSLRQAVLDGNMTTPSDTIEFAPGVSGTINLASTIVVTRSTIIDGPGSDKLRVVNPTSVAFFQNDTLPSGINVSFEGLTVEGHSSGPGSAGGAFRLGSGASTTIRNCAMTGTAANQGGAIFISDIPAVSVIDSTITGATAGSLGGAIYSRDAGLVVSGSTLAGNKGSGGGAIDVENPSAIRPASLAVTDSEITGNEATSLDGGGIEVNAADGPTSIVRSIVSGNRAPLRHGGGLYFGYASSLTIDSSTFAQNTAADGAGLYIEAPTGPTVISDSTIASNVTTGKGGGIYSFGYYDKPVRIQNSTIASNSAGTGGGIFRVGFDASGPPYEGPDNIDLASTIVAGNLAATGTDLADGPTASPSGSFRALSSLIGSTSGADVTEVTPGTNKLNTGPIALAPLADNGGPTPTMLPALGGPAIDSGTANGLTSDGRGLARTFDQPATPNASGSDGTDIGAVEVGDSAVDGAELKVKKKQKVKGKKVVVTIRASADEAVTVTAEGTVKLGKKKLPLKDVQADVSAGGTATLKLKPAGKKAARKILKALGGGKKAKASVTVQFADPAGNAETLDATTKLAKGKSKKK